MKDFNINEHVLVKLNPIGLAELERQFNELKADMTLLPDYTPPVADSDGYYKFQMWNLMNTFGHMMRPTMEPPFDTNVKFNIKESENDK